MLGYLWNLCVWYRTPFRNCPFPLVGRCSYTATGEEIDPWCIGNCCSCGWTKASVLFFILPVFLPRHHWRFFTYKWRLIFLTYLFYCALSPAAPPSAPRPPPAYTRDQDAFAEVVGLCQGFTAGDMCAVAATAVDLSTSRSPQHRGFKAIAGQEFHHSHGEALRAAFRQVSCKFLGGVMKCRACAVRVASWGCVFRAVGLLRGAGGAGGVEYFRTVGDRVRCRLLCRRGRLVCRKTSGQPSYRASSCF